MKKLILVIVFLWAICRVYAQDLTISFLPKVSDTPIDSIQATNLRTNQIVTLLGGESLLLVKIANSSHPLLYKTEIGTIYPNPTDESATFYFSTDKRQQVEIRLYNANGQMLNKKRQSLDQGTHRFELKFPVAGIYFISLIKSNESASFKAVYTGKTIQNSFISYAGSDKLNSQITDAHSLKGASADKILTYTEGDFIQYSVSSGVNTTIITETPTVSKVFDVDFVNCIDKDNKSYKAVKIGDQWWMAENLAYLPAVNPPSIGSDTASCFYVYDYIGTDVAAAKLTANYNTYGVLYNWPAAIASCPPGWHLPSDAEWKQLEMTLGMTQSQADSTGLRGTDQGTQMKATSGWNINGNGTNSSGFATLPAGGRYGTGIFGGIGANGLWWSSTEYPTTNAWERYLLASQSGGVYRTNNGIGKATGATVRCVKDEYSSDEIVIAKDVQVIDNQVWDNYLIAIDTSDYTILFSKDISLTHSFKAGDYIVSSSGKGLLRKIESVSTVGDEIVLQTEFASLTDIIEQGDIEIDELCNTSQVEKIDYYYSGINLVRTKGPDQTLFDWDINAVLYDKDGNESTTHDQIKLLGNFSSTFRLIGKIKISWKLKMKEAKFGFKSSENLELDLISAEKYSFEKKYPLATVYFTSITFFVGPVPVVITPKLTIIIGIDGSSGGPLSSGITQSLSFDAGIKYAKGPGWSSYSDFDKNYSAQPINLNARARAGMYLKPEFAMLLYGVTGPYTNLKLYGRLQADYHIVDPNAGAFDWKLYGGIMMGAGVKIDIFDKYLLSYGKGDLFKDELLLAQATMPVSLPTVTTNIITSMTSYSAIGGGNVTSDGGAAVTTRGVCWSRSQNPTTADYTTNDGIGKGAYTSNLTGLNANTTYYVRAYAKNNVGTSYGNQVSFASNPLGWPPVANFTASPTTITAENTVTFTDQSTNTPTSWLWDFGDEGSSTSQNPTHVYNTPGSYTVTLTATNSFGSDGETKSNYITVNPAGSVPVAAFTGAPTTIIVRGTVTFTDQSTNTPTSWLWNFGDGKYNSLQNPTHVYTTAGTYTVTLTAANSFGSDDETKSSYITVNPAGSAPVAAFTGAPTTVATGGTVTFTDQSTNTPTSWLWNFGDGGTSTSQNPTHVYNTAGTYTVTLTATNSFGSDGETKSSYIRAGNAPVAEFTGAPRWSTTVTFTDQSTNTPTSWLWDFGDGEISTLQNPAHVYIHNQDCFTVTLTVTNSFGSNTTKKINYICIEGH